MCFNKYESFHKNYTRIVYVDNVYKRFGIDRAICLANCYVNMIFLGSRYYNNKEIYEYYPKEIKDKESLYYCTEINNYI